LDISKTYNSEELNTLTKKSNNDNNDENKIENEDKEDLENIKDDEIIYLLFRELIQRYCL